MILDDRQYEEEDKEATKEFVSDDDLTEEGFDEPSFEPECTEASDDDDIECEFENRDGHWWCTTHNCWA